MLLEDDGTLDEQHSGARTVVLHLLPGALITAFYAGAAPLVRSLGFPSLMAIFLAIAFVLIPFELGYLIYQARTNGSTLGRGRRFSTPCSSRSTTSSHPG